MTDKKLIRAEIERKRASYFGNATTFTIAQKMVLTELLSFIDSMQEEPVSEDLEEAADNYARKNPAYAVDKWGNWSACNREKPKFDFMAGAKWQKQQDQETIELAEDHAMFAGMEKMKEQMMAKAVNAQVKIDAGGYPYIPQIELYDYDKDVPLAKEGDKYKVVLIKED